MTSRSTVDGWAPKNHTGTYRGAVTLRDSFAQSINTVAVKLADEVGRGNVVSTARRLGIRSELHDRPSIALGTAEVTPLELVAAYVPFANGGEGITPHIIARVRNGDGKLLYEYKGAGLARVVDESYVAEMNDMMNATHGQRHRKAGGAARPDRRRQNGDQPKLARRLVRRLHRALCRWRLGRQ